MAQQPDSQQITSGPSASLIPTAASTSRNARHRVVMQWEKQSKIKTCKCKICDGRVKKFCHRCKSCGRRICSECSEAYGQSLPVYKEIALDYLQNGCWCGFRSNFNSAFRDRIPQGLSTRPVVTAPVVLEGNKRKRKQSVMTDAGSSRVTAAQPKSSGKLLHPDDTDVEHAHSVTPGSTTGRHQIPRTPGRISLKRAAQGNTVIASPNDPKHEELVAKKISVVGNLHEAKALQAKIEKILPENEADTPAPRDLERSSLLDAVAKEARRAKRPSRKPEVPDHEPNTGCGSTSSGPRATSSRTKPVKGPDSHNIVVIGAGVIGMFIALELAKKAYASGKKQEITVVDINSTPFCLASGQSAGFLTIRDMPDSWLPLVSAAAPILGDLIDSEGFCHAVGFSEEVFTTAETGKRRHHPINRLNASIEENVVYDEDTIGLIDSVKLGHWLHNQCEGYGVEFRFSSHPTKVEKDRVGKFTGVRVQKIDTNGGKAETLRCSDLVLAAGPFTKSLFSQLFPSSSLLLENHVQTTQWIELSHAGFGNGRKAGVVMPNATTEDDTLKGHLGLVVDPLKGVIKASCSRISARATELKQRNALEGRDHSTVALSELAAKYLTSKQPGVDDDSKVAAHGSAYVSTGPGSTGPGSTPVIGMIRPTLLDSVSGLVGGASIWLCYGFGDFGTTVAPGVGRAIAEMILGGAATVDFGDFAIQKEHRP